MRRETFRPLLVLLLFALFPLPALSQEDEAKSEGQPMSDRDPALILKVNNAVQAGLEWLEKRQGPDGEWKCAWDGREPPGRLPAAETALALLALMTGGLPSNCEIIWKGFTWLRMQPLLSTMEAALILMALEAKVRGTGRPPRMENPDKDWMRQCVECLLRYRASSGRLLGATPDEARKVQDIWAAPWKLPDHANTFWALLGLRSAAHCGIEVPREVWISALDHFLEAQERKGPRVLRVRMVEDREHGYVSYKLAARRPDVARGWCAGASLLPKDDSTDGPDAVSGGMTCAGISGIAICLSELGRKCPLFFEMFGKMALRDGIAWLTYNLNSTIGRNPIRTERTGLFFYMYGLQCAGILTSQRNFNQHDWYRQGAEFLFGKQKPDGSWDDETSPGPVTNTCFALLFLTRSTAPGRVILK